MQTVTWSKCMKREVKLKKLSKASEEDDGDEIDNLRGCHLIGHQGWESQKQEAKQTATRDSEIKQKLTQQAHKRSQVRDTSPLLAAAHQFSLLIWSPNPGVSITVSFIFTPFSSITRQKEQMQRCLYA